MGFKALGSNNSIDSLGVIVYDTTCDLDDPLGNKKEEEKSSTEKETSPKEPVVVVIPETDNP